MPQQQLMRSGLRALLNALILTMVFAIGIVVAFFLHPQIAARLESEDHDHGPPHVDPADDDHEEPHEDDHVALTEQAYANLDLRMAPVTRGDHWKTLLVPGRVVEIPGRSDLSISAPVTGVIEEVVALSGQSIAAETPLFEIRITDETLIDAQSKLLDTLISQEVAEKEIERLEPLIDSGVLAGSRKRELEYELKQLQTQQSTLLQELRGRGLPQESINELLRSRILASALTVYPPRYIVPGDSGVNPLSSGYSVERLAVHPGKSVTRGETLCTVAYHTRLFVEGTAFEDDLLVLNRIAENGWDMEIETHGQNEYEVESPKLQLLRIDNHVDEASQTLKFYAELTNEVTSVRRNGDHIYEQWRFRPGQRLHVRLPVERWRDQLMLPIDAVVIDGPDVFVFAEHALEDEEEPWDEHDSEVFMELEPIPVRMLYRDDRTVVIANDGQIEGDRPIAQNHAYKLYLAMKRQAGGGSDHHHHDH